MLSVLKLSSCLIKLARFLAAAASPVACCISPIKLSLFEVNAIYKAQCCQMLNLICLVYKNYGVFFYLVYVDF